MVSNPPWKFVSEAPDHLIASFGVSILSILKYTLKILQFQLIYKETSLRVIGYVNKDCLVLTGCSSTIKKIEEVTLNYLEESYHISDAEVISIEPTEPTEQYGSIVVVAFERIFVGRTYDVHVKINDSVSTIMKGKVNKRELIFRNDN